MVRGAAPLPPWTDGLGIRSSKGAALPRGWPARIAFDRPPKPPTGVLGARPPPAVHFGHPRSVRRRFVDASLRRGQARVSSQGRRNLQRLHRLAFEHVRVVAGLQRLRRRRHGLHDAARGPLPAVDEHVQDRIRL